MSEIIQPNNSIDLKANIVNAQIPAIIALLNDYDINSDSEVAGSTLSTLSVIWGKLDDMTELLTNCLPPQ